MPLELGLWTGMKTDLTWLKKTMFVVHMCENKIHARIEDNYSIYVYSNVRSGDLIGDK